MKQIHQRDELAAKPAMLKHAVAPAPMDPVERLCLVQEKDNTGCIGACAVAADRAQKLEVFDDVAATYKSFLIRMHQLLNGWLNTGGRYGR